VVVESVEAKWHDIEDALARLPFIYRITIILHDVECWPVRLIAEALNQARCWPSRAASCPG